MIKQINKTADLADCAELIRKSFKTVADELNLTEQNAPSNPAFLKDQKFIESCGRGLNIFVLSLDGIMAGCVAVEKSPDKPDTFYIERLAVLPEHRHSGFGTVLMNHAFKFIKENNGKTASIGIINENKKLKDWYLKYGFKETGLKTFEHLPFTVCFMEKAVK